MGTFLCSDKAENKFQLRRNNVPLERRGFSSNPA